MVECSKLREWVVVDGSLLWKLRFSIDRCWCHLGRSDFLRHPSYFTNNGCFNMTTASSKNKSTAANGENRSIADTTARCGRMEADTSHFLRRLPDKPVFSIISAFQGTEILKTFLDNFNWETNGKSLISRWEAPGKSLGSLWEACEICFCSRNI